MIRTKLFRRFMRMMRCVEVVTVGDMRVMRRFRMITIRMVFCGLIVVLRRQLMVLCSFLVVVCNSVRLHGEFLRIFERGCASESPSRPVRQCDRRRWRVPL